MKLFFKLSILTWGAQFLFVGNSFAASDRGTDIEAKNMVVKAVALIKSVGPDKDYKVFTDHPDGVFKDRNLYVFVYGFDDVCLAQGENSKMVDKNLINIKDVDGIAFIQGEIDMVKAKKKGWYGPHKFNNVANQSRSRSHTANRVQLTRWYALAPIRQIDLDVTKIQPVEQLREELSVFIHRT